MQEVGGAVQRIHDPYQSAGHYLRLQVLAYDARAGLGGQQHLGDDAFGGPIHLGHEIPASLLGPPAGVGRPLDPPEILGRPLGRDPGQMQ